MKRIALVLLMVIGLVSPSIAETTFSFTKPLCAFPFGKVIYNIPDKDPVGYAGAFFVQYDGRFYDDSYAGQNSLPNGGIKFALELGYYAQPSDRDAAVNQVASLTLVNTSLKETHIIAKAYSYSFTDRFANTSHVADYTLWLGNASNAVGKWKAYLVHATGVYSADFEITREMIISSKSPIPVEIASVSTDQVCFDTNTSSTDYRVRIFDSASNIVYDSKPALPAEGTRVCSGPLPYSGYSGRVEARLMSGYWLIIGPPWLKNAAGIWGWGSACAMGFQTNMTSRASTYFKLN